MLLKIVLWMPSKSLLIKEIDDKKLRGAYDSKPIGDGFYKIETVQINESAKNIIKLIEQEDRCFFRWDNPYFFIKLTNK